MSYTYLQDALDTLKIDGIFGNEEMHSMHETETNLRFQEVHAGRSFLLVSRVRAGVSARALREESRNEQDSLCKLEGEIRIEVCRETKARTRQILRLRNRQKIQSYKGRCRQTSRTRRQEVQGVRSGFRCDEAASQKELGSLPRHREGARISMLTMQHSSRICK